LLAQLRGAAPRVDPRLPQGLIGEQISDTRNCALIQQARLDRGPAAPDQAMKRLASDVGGIGTDVAVVGIEHSPTEAALVAQGKAASVGEADAETIPTRGVVGVDDDPSRHTQ